MAQEYFTSYSSTIIKLFLVTALKRVFTDQHISFKDLAIHFVCLGIFIGIKCLYSINENTKRYVPMVIAFYSYVCHSTFIFKGLFG